MSEYEVKLPSGRTVHCETPDEVARVRDWLRWMDDESRARARRAAEDARAGALCGAVSVNPETGCGVTCKMLLHGGICRYHGRRSGA